MTNIEQAHKKLNDIRQLVQTVSERPAAKTTGERATFIAYRETTWLKRQLGELSETLKLIAAGETEPTTPENFGTLVGSRIMREQISLDDLEAWVKESHENGHLTTPDDVTEHFDVSTGLAYAALLKLENEKRIVRLKGEYRTFTYSDVG